MLRLLFVLFVAGEAAAYVSGPPHMILRHVDVLGWKWMIDPANVPWTVALWFTNVVMVVLAPTLALHLLRRLTTTRKAMPMAAAPAPQPEPFPEIKVET